jgi:GAF domain-containing protein
MAQDPAADVTAALRAGLANLGPARPDLGTLLEQTMTATRRVLKVTGAGLMMLDEQQDLRYVGASDEGGRALEAAQLRRGVGPGFDSLATMRTVSVADITAHLTYRGLAEDLNGAGVRAVLATPVRIAGHGVGVLNLYRSEACAWSEEDEAGARAFADVLGMLLRTAVQSRQQDAVVRRLQLLLDPFRDEPYGK